jgi:hypothetical protein
VTDRVATIQLAKPFPLQQRVLDDQARFKLFPWGRRTGKSRLCWHAAFMGHGPRDAADVPLHKGILHGWDVAWVAPDFPQAGTMWEEEVRPRFLGVDGIYLNETKRVVRINGLGSLWIKSFENIRSVRGIGANLIGVICEECAHWDLEVAWRKILRPALMDNGGWSLFPSSPNYMTDGHAEDRTPSFFNSLCGQVLGGTRGDDWGIWQADARQNPNIEPKEFDALVAEYPEDSDDVKEEVFGMLLKSGQGNAFPEWRKEVHLKPLEPDVDDVPAAGLDWGFSSPGWFGLGYQGARRLLLRHEIYYQGKKPRMVGREIGELCLEAFDRHGTVPDTIWADASIFDTTDGGVTIGERIQEGIEAAWVEGANNRPKATLPAAPQVMPAPKGPGSIRTRTILLKEALAFLRDDDTGEVLEPPAMLVHPDCKDFARVVAVIPLDPKKREQFNTAAEDHPIDGWTYLLIARGADWKGSNAESRELKEKKKKLDALSQREAIEWEKLEKKMERETRRRRTSRHSTNG